MVTNERTLYRDQGLICDWIADLPRVCIHFGASRASYRVVPNVGLAALRDKATWVPTRVCTWDVDHERVLAQVGRMQGLRQVRVRVER